MSEKQEHRVPTWTRWAPLARRTESGRRLFVCLVCGRTSTVPADECQELVPIVNSGLLKCEVFEEIVRINIDAQRPEKIKLDWGEEMLKAEHNRVCSECHGWGCQYCQVTCMVWGNGE